jgi:hypothetical protein
MVEIEILMLFSKLHIANWALSRTSITVWGLDVDASVCHLLYSCAEMRSSRPKSDGGFTERSEPHTNT